MQGTIPAPDVMEDLKHPIPSVNDQIQADHQAISSKRAELTGAFDADRIDDANYEAWKLDTLRRLRNFQAILLMHFDLEEVTAFKEEVLGMAPQFASRMAHLEEEHLKIARDLDHVITLFKRTHGPEDPILVRLRKRLAAVLELLHEHEEEERDLFQKAMYQELGVGD